MNPQNKTIAANGCVLITGTSSNNIDAWALVPNADAVIASLTFKDDSDAVTALNISGQTLTQGSFIPCSDAKEAFKTIQLTSGSVWAYNK